MPRCNDCNKFVSLDSEQEPEVNLDVDDEGHVTGTAEIINACGECGTDLRSACLDLDVDPESIHDPEGNSISDWLAGLTDDGRKSATFEVEEVSSERTMRTEGKGRGQRTFYGARVEIEVTGSVEVPTGADDDSTETKTKTFSGVAENEVQASGMDEC